VSKGINLSDRKGFALSAAEITDAQQELRLMRAASTPSSRPACRARRHTLRWWAAEYDLPVSTIYKAIYNGHLKARQPPRRFVHHFARRLRRLVQHGGEGGSSVLASRQTDYSPAARAGLAPEIPARSIFSAT
jgi:hypothetical protein